MMAQTKLTNICSTPQLLGSVLGMRSGAVIRARNGKPNEPDEAPADPAQDSALNPLVHTVEYGAVEDVEGASDPKAGISDGRGEPTTARKELEERPARRS